MGEPDLTKLFLLQSSSYVSFKENKVSYLKQIMVGGHIESAGQNTPLKELFELAVH